jgi:hypothetical protein
MADVLRGFWGQAPVQGILRYVGMFPRRAGSHACRIPTGSPTPVGRKPFTIRAVCTTQVLARAGYLAVLPASPSTRPVAGAVGAVVLTERLKGTLSQGSDLAHWIFPFDARGRVLGVQIAGIPPQLWR